jgi:hypothetical protein
MVSAPRRLASRIAVEGIRKRCTNMIKGSWRGGQYYATSVRRSSRPELFYTRDQTRYRGPLGTPTLELLV